MQGHMFVEEAFQKIRTATGFSDVNEIVHRFLTREQTYSQLLMAVSENERKIENLRKDHETWGFKLHELQMEDDQDQQKGNKNKTNRDESHPFSPEIEVLDKQIVTLTKDKEKSDELCSKVNLVFDQVQGWCSKVIQKIDQQFGENISAFEHNKTLAYLFEKIAEAVTKQLQQIIEEDDRDRDFITAKDFMNDFATEEFLNKNIRVRPLSGVSRGNIDDGKTNDHYNKSLHNDPYGQNGDEDDKFDQIKILEMEEQRVHAKEKRDAFLKKKQLEEEKAAKKRR